MKKYFLFFLGLFFIMGTGIAQKYFIIDTRNIFDKMPDYKQVQQSIDGVASEWQKEIDAKQGALDKLYDDYNAQEATLSGEAKRKKEDELYKKEKELSNLQKKRFGFEGDLFKKRQELMEPLQQKVVQVVQKMAHDNGCDLVLDKSEGKSIIFADPKLDKSEEVIRILVGK